MRTRVLHRIVPDSLEHAAQLVADGATLLAGGQVLVPELKLRRSNATVLIDVSQLSVANDVSLTNVGSLHIGALTTVTSLTENAELARVCPWLVQAANAIGDVQTRNRATLGGNLAWSDPRANLLVALIAAGASATLVDDGGVSTTMAVDDIPTGFRTNGLDGKVITGIEIPDVSQLSGSYLEFSRQKQELALVNVCAVKRGDRIKFAIGGIADRPLVIEQDRSKDITDDVLRQGLATQNAEAIPNAHGPLAYRLVLATTLINRTIAEIV